ncbi:unnamed protein product [Calypogeia fissa]
MMKGGCNGVDKVRKQKSFEVIGGETRNVHRSSSTVMQIEDILGEELEGTPGSCLECNMCGDVGFQDHLLHCSRCHEHQEHSYCSPSYRELGSDETSWVCDWCWPAMKRESSKSESAGQESESFLVDGHASGRQSIGSIGTVAQNQNGLDLLLEVAWATADLKDLPPSLSSMEKDVLRCTTGTKGMEKEVSRTTTGSPTTSAKLESSSHSKTSSGGKRKQQGLASDRWSVTQKRVCSRNYDSICARTGIQLETSNSLSKGLGRRYRLLSSMLC